MNLAWMSDEQYELMQDTKEKKHTARSARNTRTHCGKSGCTFSHERMTKKELAAMNGKVETFRMNDPMTWDEFKRLPDDLKVIYVKNLRRAYGVPDNRLAEAWGVSQFTVSKWFKTLGLGEGRAAGYAKRGWDPTEFLAWWNGVDIPKKAEEAPVEDPVEEVAEKIEEPTEENPEKPMWGRNTYDDGTSTYSTCAASCAIPMQGSMSFEGDVDDILRTVSKVLDGRNVRLKVEWEVV